MKSKIFYKEIEVLLFMITRYGMSKCTFELNHENMTQEHMDIFTQNVHIGFMKAQQIVVNNLILIADEKTKCKKNLKDARLLKKEKQKIIEIERIIKKLEFQDTVFRKMGDSIVWQLVNYDNTVINRLYQSKPKIDIRNANIDYDLNVIAEMFEEDKSKFPLLCDITNIAQIGDILIHDHLKGINGIIELKDGKVNEEIKRILNNYDISNCEFQLACELQDKSESFYKQFKRYVKQHDRILRTVETINKGVGIDVSTGLNVRTPQEIIEVQYFDDRIAKMLKTVRDKNSAIDVIDECLLVGVYSKKTMNLENAFDVWAKCMNIEFPIVNYMSHINNPTAFPLFLNIFSNDDIMRVLKGEVSIKLTLDIEIWLKRLEKKGYKYRWLSEKETARHSSKFKGMEPFKYQNKALTIGDGEFETYIYEGIFAKMFYNFITPDSIIKTFERYKTNED